MSHLSSGSVTVCDLMMWQCALNSWRACCKAAAAVLKGVNLLLHAGDVGHHGGHAEVLKAFAEATCAPVLAVAGNVDDEPGASQLLPDHRVLDVAGWKLLLLHIVAPSPKSKVDAAAAALIAEHRPDLVVFGHSHKAAHWQADGVHFINPGSAGPARFKLKRSVATLCLTPRAAAGAPLQLNVKHLNSQQGANTNTHPALAPYTHATSHTMDPSVTSTVPAVEGPNQCDDSSQAATGLRCSKHASCASEQPHVPRGDCDTLPNIRTDTAAAGNGSHSAAISPEGTAAASSVSSGEPHQPVAAEQQPLLLRVQQAVQVLPQVHTAASVVEQLPQSQSRLCFFELPPKAPARLTLKKKDAGGP